MIFSNFNQEDIVTGRINQVSSGMFGGNLYITQNTFTTSSAQGNVFTGSGKLDVKNGQYYMDVYADVNNTGTSTQYFSIAYGDYVNSGSSLLNEPSQGSEGVYINETKVIYSQYKNTLLQPGDNLFSFASGSISSLQDSEAIFVLNFTSDQFKDQIDPGQLQVNFNGLNGKFKYIDDSSIINKEQNVYNMISGSVVNGVPTPYKNAAGNYVYNGIGLFYPKSGVVIFNAINLDAEVGITGTANNPEITKTRSQTKNLVKYKQYWTDWLRDFWKSLNGSTDSMAVRRSEFVPSTHYFVRVKNRDFNYTNNPSFISDGTDGKSKGTIIYQDLINSPKTYITTVGLYNENNELLAIGKLSKPTQKTFDNELLIKVRLDF